MGSILQPFTNTVNPGSFFVPAGQLRIDFSNGLANSLIGAWVPGAMGGIDLCGNAPPMTFQSASGVYDDTPEGAGLKANASNSGMYSTVGTGGVFTSWTSLTMFSRWLGLGNAASGSEYFSIVYNSAGGSPFIVAGIDDDGATNHFRIDWNTGGSLVQQTTTQAETTGIFDIACSYVSGVGNSSQFYFNGVAGSTRMFGANAPTSSATTYIAIGSDQATTTRNPNATCLCAYIWNRALAASEVFAMHQSPYGFLVPAEYEMPAISVVSSSSTVVFRRSLSAFGTRVGSRQLQA